MTTATTPSQPAKRAKGRAHTLYMEHTYREQCGFVNVWAYNTGDHGGSVVEPVAVLNFAEYDATVERMARAMFAENFGIYSWSHEKAIWRVERENFTAQARAALKSIGIAAPRKERKK